MYKGCEELGEGGGSDGQAKHGADAVHRLVLPSHGAAPVGGGVPPAGGSGVESSTCNPIPACVAFLIRIQGTN